MRIGRPELKTELGKQENTVQQEALQISIHSGTAAKMGENEKEETGVVRGRGLKRTPMRRHSTGSDAVPEASQGFQTPRALAAQKATQGWLRPRVSLARLTNSQDQEDGEKWNRKLATLPLYSAVFPSHGEAV